MKTVNPKKLLIFAQLFVLLAFGSMSAFASDYQYKVLDTKYNPAAEQLLNGTIQKEEPVVAKSKKKGFDFLRFFAILAMIMFPYFVVKTSVKTFAKTVYCLKNRDEIETANETVDEETKDTETEDIKTEDNKTPEKQMITTKSETQTAPKIVKPAKSIAVTQPVQKELKKTEEIEKIDKLKRSERAEKVEKIVEIEVKLEETNIIDKENTKTENIEEKLSPQPQKEEKSPEKAENSIENDTKALLKSARDNKSTVTKPLNKKNPILLNTAKLTEDKGFCIVEYKNKYSLIGYIGEKVFLLNQFDSLSNAEIRPRYTETYNNKERYIVRLGTSYKALIEVGEQDINLLLKL